jgi:hypothetical protein
MPSLFQFLCSKVSWWAWKAWNRTRYYWPQAQSRKRTIANLERGYAELGVEWKRSKPWWLP